MNTYITTAHKPMPRTKAAIVAGTRHTLTEIGVRPPDFVFMIGTQGVGTHIDRVVVSLPRGHYDESVQWYEKLREALPWHCRVTVIPEVGRIEIEPRGR